MDESQILGAPVPDGERYLHFPCVCIGLCRYVTYPC